MLKSNQIFIYYLKTFILDSNKILLNSILNIISKKNVKLCEDEFYKINATRVTNTFDWSIFYA